MTNAETNKAFLASVEAKTKSEVLASIGQRYGISRHEALAEVTGDDAEHLLDYLTGPTRAAVSVLMQRQRLAA